MIGLATSYRNAPVGNNATFQQPNPFDYREDFVRLDYRFNSSHTIYGRYIHDENQLIDPFGTFITSQLPTVPSARSRPGTSIQVAYTWLITPTLVNEAKVNTSWISQHIPPAGDFWKRETYGFQFAQLFPGGGAYSDSIPDTTINGFASFAGAARSLVSPTTDIMLGDNVTWVHGAHTLKTGAVFYRNRIDQNGRTTYAGNVTFNAAGNTRSTGNAFADALLGNFRTYSESSFDPVGFFRFTQTEAFVNDSWKVTPRFSLELGVRYQFGTPFYTQANNLANFDPALYNPAQAVTVLANGTIDPARGGNRLNGLVRAGHGVPAEELGRVPGGDSAFVQSVPAGAPRGLYNGHHYLHAARRLRLLAVQGQQDGHTRRLRHLLRPRRGQPHLPVRGQPALRDQLAVLEREPLEHHERRDDHRALRHHQRRRPEPRHALHAELQPERPARAAVGLLRRGGLRRQPRAPPDQAARHQPGHVRRRSRPTPRSRPRSARTRTRSGPTRVTRPSACVCPTRPRTTTACSSSPRSARGARARP